MELHGVIAGLGNPGLQYAGTRHNTGFSAIQSFLEKASKSGAVIDKVNGARFKAEVWRIHFDDEATWIFMEPQTFMNLSGEAVQSLMSWHKIPIEKLLVVHDELDLPVGRIKLQFGGSPAGHNGIKSIQQCLGSGNFYRLRIGIGRPLEKDDTISWVLSRFSNADKEIMEKTMPLAAEALEAFVRHGPIKAMNFANCRSNRINGS